MRRIVVGMVALAATVNVALAQPYPIEDPRPQTERPASTRMPVTMPADPDPIDPTTTVPPSDLVPVPPPAVSLEQPI
ncbi:MAG TPA: hypothetical protein VFQ65_25890, partial [Kofleriaceae bacterium]|nr:hypothetical protein [Kofleriaceae bacterium]